MRSRSKSKTRTRGSVGAPRSFFGRILTVLVVLIALTALLAALSGRFSRGTETGSLIGRAFAAVAVGLLLITLVRRMFGALGAAPPPPPTKIDARRSDVVYECLVCGTRVRLEVAATTKPPKHCGEEMEAQIG